MDRKAIYTQISEYLATAFDVPRDLITPEADLVDKLNLDSIDAIDVMTATRSRDVAAVISTTSRNVSATVVALVTWSQRP